MYERTSLVTRSLRENEHYLVSASHNALCVTEWVAHGLPWLRCFRGNQPTVRVS